MSAVEPQLPVPSLIRQLSVSFSKEISTEITDNLSAEFEDFEDDPVLTAKGTAIEKGSEPASATEVELDRYSEKSIYYKGIVVTTIAVTNVGNGKVTFNEHNSNSLEGVFLKDICMISNPNKVAIGKRDFEATLVEPKEARAIIGRGYGNENSEYDKEEDAIPLFIFHGFKNEPSFCLGYPYHNFKAHMKYYPVPVLCAQEAKTKGMFKGYLDDQKSIAKSAGDALSALVGSIPDHFFPKKSLLLDSMGNYDVFNGACANGTPEIEFENIYMVAADVPCDIFNKRPSESFLCGKTVSSNKSIKADNFWGMLKKDEHGNPVGKVYITHNDNDILNQENRLGRKGAGWVDGWCGNYYSSDAIREEFRLYIENIDVNDNEIIIEPDGQHVYNLEPWMIDIYEATATGGYLYYE